MDMDTIAIQLTIIMVITPTCIAAVNLTVAAATVEEEVEVEGEEITSRIISSPLRTTTSRTI